MLLGFILSLLTACSEAARDISLSTAHVKVVPAPIRAIALFIIPIPIFAAIVLFRGLAETQPGFWMYLLLQALVVSTATSLHMRALSLGHVSQTQPILALTPIFLVFSNPFLTNDVLTPMAWFGVILAALGVFTCQLPENISGFGPIAALREVLREIGSVPAARTMFAVAALYSLGANLDKVCMQRSDGPTYLLYLSIFASGILVPIIVLRGSAARARSSMKLLRVIPGGVVQAATLLIQMGALSYLPVPIVIALKRCSIIIVSMWGYFVRRERKLTARRLLGLLAAVAGAAVILFHL